MKIEKLNDNQIRCTLTRDDLAKRNLRISELAYGSEKTQNLFREMVRQADYEYGFETDNVPLMVEAIPMNSGNIVLIITKVDDPEELDTRFSRFTPYSNPDDEDFDEELDDFFGNFESGSVAPEPTFGEMLGKAMDEENPNRCCVFGFDSLSRVMDFARQVRSATVESTLYKTDEGKYSLVVQPGNATKNEFRNLCLIASEYGKGKVITNTANEFMREHNDILIGEDAIKKLAG
ncbi:MAG: adaptor protein MecA [Lachnospiraceae bacterium]|nr:adaptor protein MecA [Lachnospiraceae bacterium]